MASLSPVQKECIVAFNTHNFSQAKRREWTIWGAKMNICPQCRKGVGMACVNLNDLKQAGVLFPRETVWPHAQRVDWTKIYNGLQQRGYIG